MGGVNGRPLIAGDRLGCIPYAGRATVRRAPYTTLPLLAFSASRTDVGGEVRLLLSPFDGSLPKDFRAILNMLGKHGR